MAGRHTEADRLRHCRLVFQRAARDGLAMRDAREALAIERWKAVEARLSRCGTRDTGPAEDDAGQQLQWWQK